jgi:hypothetical protein
VTAADLGAAATGAGAPVELLEIAVRTDPDRVAAFRAATGSSAEQGANHAAGEPAVPLTYPFCWMTSAAVRPVLERMIDPAVMLPIHEAQSFDYRRPLALDTDYRIAFAFERKAEPARLVVNAAVSTPTGEPCAAFETVLRLVPLARPPEAG